MSRFVDKLQKFIIGRIMADSKKSTIYIYSGEGACPENNKVTMATLKRHLDIQTYDIKFITPEETKDGQWRDSASLYVIGGGYDLGFIKCLGSHGAQQIREYVTQGGKYLGLCAGAYYACDYIEFDKGGPIEVCGDRDLNFYPGGSIGPVYGPYEYNTRYGARAAPLICDVIPSTINESQFSLLKSFHAYYSGGGFFIPGKAERYEIKKRNEHVCNGHLSKIFKEDVSFTPPPKLRKVDSEKNIINNERNPDKQKYILSARPLGIESSMPINGFHGASEIVKEGTRKRQLKGNNSRCSTTVCHNKCENVEVLASYSEVLGNPAAIVKCKVGDGSAILSGVHIEYISKDLDLTEKHLVPVIESLRHYDNIQFSYFKFLMKSLSLKTI